MPEARALLLGSAAYHLSLFGPTPTALAIALDPWPGTEAAGAALLSGDAAPPWAETRTERLAALHSFAWLADIAALADPAAWQKVRRWTQRWLDSCDVWDAIAWRADVTGDRLFAWIEHFDALAGDEDGLRGRLLASLARQARHLSRVATREAPGVPRLAALRGLVAAGAALGSERRLARALHALEREIAAQLLPDGGHVARSPAAQLSALRYLVDARAVLRAAEAEVPAGLQSALDRAAPMLRFFRHGDGRFALFNGAGEGDPDLINRVLARADAQGRAPAAAPHVGFHRLQAGGTLVIADAGAPPPRGLDGETHAGTLSFEMSQGRERLIVNCGAYHGASPDWRAGARATAAHSALVVADTNSSEIRADGSLGRRPAHVTAERAEEDGSQWLSMSHDGYHTVYGLTHARQLFLSADGDDLRGEDRLTGRSGVGFAIRFHLHPQVSASLAQDGTTALLRLPGGTGWRLRAQGAVMSLASSIYLGSGELRKSQQIVLDGHVGSTGSTVKWALRREGRKASDPAAD